MTTEKPSSNEDSGRKRRKRGYRGYPNNPGGGAVHSGSGFGGAGSLNGSGAGLPDSGIVSERTREDAEKEEEKE
ncbi:MAG: hypothetical protein WAU32_10385 [Thermoanaerobaculia bacterium]